MDRVFFSIWKDSLDCDLPDLIRKQKETSQNVGKIGKRSQKQAVYENGNRTVCDKTRFYCMYWYWYYNFDQKKKKTKTKKKKYV